MDHRNILTGLAIKKYYNEQTGGGNIRLCMQLIKPENKWHYFSSMNNNSGNDQIIIIEEIKMNLMSKSCFSPGIINFVSNLISSTSENEETGVEWLDQYAEGMGHEIYRIKLSYKLENKTFGEIADLIYKATHQIVFAIEISTNGKTVIRLNPYEFNATNIKEN